MTQTQAQTQTQTQTQTQIHKNQNQKNQNAAAIQDIYEKIHQTSKPASDMTHEIRDPHGILDIVASRSRL
jgi:hypothetical protein